MQIKEQEVNRVKDVPVANSTLSTYHKPGLDIWDTGCQKLKLKTKQQQQPNSKVSIVGRPGIGCRCHSNREEFWTDRFS